MKVAAIATGPDGFDVWTNRTSNGSKEFSGELNACIDWCHKNGYQEIRTTQAADAAIQKMDAAVMRLIDTKDWRLQ